MTHQYAGDFNYNVCPAHGAYPQFAVMCPTCQTFAANNQYGINALTPITQSLDCLVVEKLSPTAMLPTKSHTGDLGYDLYSNAPVYFQGGETKLVSTDIRVKFPDGWGAKIFDRSSIATQRGLVVVAGLLDSGYRGIIMVALCNTSQTYVAHIEQGERIAQMVPMKVVDWTIIEGKVDIEETSRKEGGFGSTNNA